MGYTRMIFALALLCRSLPVLAQSTPGQARDPAIADEGAFAAESALEPVYVRKRQTRGPAGGAAPVIMGVVMGAYISGDADVALARALGREFVEQGGDARALTIVVYQAYWPSLFAADGAWPSWDRQSGLFHRFLRQQCDTSIDYARDDVLARQRAIVDCYVEITARHLTGDTRAYGIFRIWGVDLERVEYWNPIVIPLLMATLLIFSVPQLLLYLSLVWAARPFVRERAVAQRSLKILLPIVIGVAWLALWFYVRETRGLPGVWKSFEMWLAIGGIYFALNFVACMWLADHWLFPENDPPRWWLVLLFYMFGPALLLAAGAAGGAAVGGLGAVAGGGSTSSGAKRSGGRIAGGGGAFGGGGASGRF